MFKTGTYPLTRMRRVRSHEFTRRLVRENCLLIGDLIYPIFIVEGHDITYPIESMPDIMRYSIDKAVKEAQEAYNLGIPAVALFPVINADKKTDDGQEAYNPYGLIQRAITTIKDKLPELGIITDIALDPYTTHGHDGIINKSGFVVNDKTIEILIQQTLSQVKAGADIIAPSDMMDGRIKAIRNALEAEGYSDTKIISYSAKYSSGLYGPFRDAIGSKQVKRRHDKSHYQMDPANSDEALREVGLDIQEGADIVMVKPALSYLDIINRVKTTFKIPTFAYQVSGEYAMIKASAQNNWLDEQKVAIETLLSMKRAGADAIFSYFSKKIARYLVDNNS